MAHENIRSKFPYFAIDDQGYFCSFNTDLGILLKTSQTGNVIFTYPSRDPFTEGYYGGIIDMCYDGKYFWTIGSYGDTHTYLNGVPGQYYHNHVIDKWEISDQYTIDRVEQFIYNNPGPSDLYWPLSFTVEAYYTNFSTTVSGGNSYVMMEDYWDLPRLEPGDQLLLGPNSSGESEYVTFTGTLASNMVGIASSTSYTYTTGDSIDFGKAIHWFNAYNDIEVAPTSTMGTWMRLSTISGTLIDKVVDAEYLSVDACTFNYITGIETHDNFYSLVYIKNNNAKFIDIDTYSTEMVMNIDNVRADGFTEIEVYDLVVANGCLYRLQYRSMYYDADYAWSTYNYVLSPIRAFIDSIVASVTPTILPSNGVSYAVARAIVNDQYSNPKNAALVTFVDDNETGYISDASIYTKINGVATNTYFSGVTPGTVVITMDALQVEIDD